MKWRMEKLFITLDDASVEKLTKAELLERMIQQVDAMVPTTDRTMWKKQIQKIKSRSKAEMIQLWEELEARGGVDTAGDASDSD